MLNPSVPSKNDSKIAQESIRKKILPYYLFAMNFTHGISATLFFVGKGGSKPQKENSLSANLKKLREFKYFFKYFRGEGDQKYGKKFWKKKHPPSPGEGGPFLEGTDGFSKPKNPPSNININF